VRKLLFASMALIAFGASPLRAAPAADALFNWSGWYLGGNAGWLHGQDHWAFNPPVAAGVNQVYTVTGDKPVFGGQIGFQQQTGNWLWGVELAGSGVTNWSTRPNYGINVGPRSQTKATNIWTVGPRLGWVNSQWLLFTTGGFAAAEVSSRAINAVGAIVANTSAVSEWTPGWYVGGGLEYAWTNHWVAGLEYQYVALDKSRHCNFGTCLGAAGGHNDRDITAHESIVRARLSYLFNSSR
jgi:outer membrane immunogenic protein